MDYIIIVAGGKGQRMGTDIPKQFLELAGQPILMRTIQRFADYDPAMQIILVLPREQQDYWRTLCEKHDFTVPHTIVDGGATRFESSRNGIMAIPSDVTDGVVGIHDGVRPFVSAEVIERCFETAREEFAAIPVMPFVETLRYVDRHGGGHNVMREDYKVVQTPQTFDLTLLRKAFEQPYQDNFTDDASVVENLGCTVQTVEGNRENIKITTPFDLKVGELLC